MFAGRLLYRICIGFLVCPGFTLPRFRGLGFGFGGVWGLGLLERVIVCTGQGARPAWRRDAIAHHGSFLYTSYGAKQRLQLFLLLLSLLVHTSGSGMEARKGESITKPDRSDCLGFR